MMSKFFLSQVGGMCGRWYSFTEGPVKIEENKVT